MSKQNNIFIGVLFKEDNSEPNFLRNSFYLKNLIENTSKTKIKEDETFQELSQEMKELLIFIKDNNEQFELKNIDNEEELLGLQFKTQKPINFSTIDTFTFNNQEVANIHSEVIKCVNACEKYLSKELFKTLHPMIGLVFIPFD